MKSEERKIAGCAECMVGYCLYEMMDNVHIHSGKPLGTAMTHFDEAQKVLRIYAFF